MHVFHVSIDPAPGTQIGGRGFCSGRGHKLTYRNWVYLPSNAKTSSSSHARRISSSASAYFSLRVAGLTPYPNAVSIAEPTGNPATSLPPLMQSSMANSSATRIGGSYRAIELPITIIATSSVSRDIAAAMMFGEGIRPYAFWWCSFTQMPSYPTSAAYLSSSSVWL